MEGAKPETASDIGVSRPQQSGALAAIAKQHDELLTQETLELFVPGYEGKMMVRYRLLPDAEMDRLSKRQEGVKAGDGITGEWKMEAQMLVDLCESILVRAPEAEDYEVLEDENGPLRFEGRFAKLMTAAGVKGLNAGRARDIVTDFFSPRTNPADPTSPRLFPSAMDRHVTAIFAWYRGNREAIDRRLLGE